MRVVVTHVETVALVLATPTPTPVSAYQGMKGFSVK